MCCNFVCCLRDSLTFWASHSCTTSSLYIVCTWQVPLVFVFPYVFVFDLVVWAGPLRRWLRVTGDYLCRIWSFVTGPARYLLRHPLPLALQHLPIWYQNIWYHTYQMISKQIIIYIQLVSNIQYRIIRHWTRPISITTSSPCTIFQYMISKHSIILTIYDIKTYDITPICFNI